ncbi:uncharacterized protein LOC126740500 isoform X3 [Anthonomus grandis grandis]|uniref:uncharacterized protein LOC126740500 isoform X3 n=1 Tax=Anthonomus grandis grandis TaxID=2921223 RepID=UPI0021655288|nr:uncharacterized protein LOC126740500 isoform X3 [Anthonomus grandis grandis]
MRSEFIVVTRKPTFPDSLTDLHRFRKTAHGHDGSSRIIMVRKTDQRTFASLNDGEEPTLNTVTRETVETFRGQRSECKVTTEKKDFGEKCPPEIVEALAEKASQTPKKTPVRKSSNPKSDFQLECLRAHNAYRKSHGVPPLKLDKEICKFSQQWADHLVRRGALVHSNNRDYGENIFMMQSSNPNFTVSGNEAVDSWYDEIKFHKFGEEPKSLSSGHFTQVIWKDSTQLGVAFAKHKDTVIVVANYYPPGNIIGSFSKNVPPPEELLPSHNNNNTIELSGIKFKVYFSFNYCFVYFIAPLSKLSITSRSSSKDLRSVTEGSFNEVFLEAHNNYRKMHGVAPLQLDKSLCRYAEEWAKHLASKNILEHRPESNYGENIYCLYTSDPSFKINGNTPVDTWYEEIKNHPFGREPSNLKSGHFSQVIWKSSETLGVGVAKSTQGSIYVVANYFPAGNFIGHYVENCPPVKPKFYKNISDRPEVDDSTDGLGENRKTDVEDLADEFAREALKVHNEYRRKHGVPDIKLSREICSFAQDWAETCARTASLQHRANNPYGENIFSMYSSDYSHVPTARDAVKEWYDEIKKYTFGVERVPQGSLHFTQVIWKASTTLGVGIAKNKKGQTYVVCNYHPKGNFIGQFSENVPKPRP